MSYGIDIASNLAGLEGRGHQFALPTVKLPFADEETIACKGLMHQPSLVKIISMLDQNALDMFWFVEQNHRD